MPTHRKKNPAPLTQDEKIEKIVPLIEDWEKRVVKGAIVPALRQNNRSNEVGDAIEESSKEHRDTGPYRELIDTLAFRDPSAQAEALLLAKRALASYYERFGYGNSQRTREQYVDKEIKIIQKEFGIEPERQRK